MRQAGGLGLQPTHIFTEVKARHMTDSPATVYVTVKFPADEYRRFLPLRQDGETVEAFVRRLAVEGAWSISESPFREPSAGVPPSTRRRAG